MDIVVEHRDEFAKMLPRHLDIDRFVRVTLAAFRKTPKLGQCGAPSLYLALCKCAELGFEPNSVFGYVHLVPFKTNRRGSDGRWTECLEVQVIIGYQGYVELGHRSGLLSTITPRAVYERDYLDVEWGDADRIVHRPYLGDDDPGRLVGAYMIVRMKDGGVQRTYVPRRDIERARRFAKGAFTMDNGKLALDAEGKPIPDSNSPWTRFYDQMATKTAVLRGFKYLPKSPEIQRALELDDDAFVPGHDELVEATEVPNVRRTQGQLLAERLSVQLEDGEPVGNHNGQQADHAAAATVVAQEPPAGEGATVGPRAGGSP